MAYNTSSGYKTVIYSGDSNNKLLLKFNNVELENADIYCEKITIKSRILPNGNNRFSLENFISKEVEMILHDIDVNSIVNQVYIAIGTFVGSAYEYVPIGIFNIQDKPITDGNKITITLRDNSVKFDFDYNAKPLIDLNGGTATKLQILQDICSQAGVECDITTFLGSTDLIGIYDSTIKGRKYISYLAGQAGMIPTIDRDGKLIFVNINSLSTRIIPLSIVEKYLNGDSYKISKTIYESGIIKYESGTETDDILYLDSSNPYITSQEQLDSIHSLVNGFEINSLSTGKTLGDPSIDSYDLISITDGTNTYLTLATNTLIYQKSMIQTFDTQISLEARETNISKDSDATFKKYAKTSIDNINAEVNIIVENQNDQQTQITEITTSVNGIDLSISNINNSLSNQSQSILDLEASIDGIDLQISKTGGNNIFSNPVCYFFDGVQTADDWLGVAKSYTDTEIKNNTISGNCFFLQNSTIEQTIQVPNDTYTISFLYKKIISLSNCSININGNIIELNEENWKNESLTFDVTANTIVVQIISDTNDSCYLSDLMGNIGTLVQVWSNNPNEAVNGGVKIGKGIEITSSTSNIKQKMDNDGNRIINTNTNEVVSEFTDKGLNTEEIIANKGQVSKILIIDMGNQTWFSRM